MKVLDSIIAVGFPYAEKIGAELSAYDGKVNAIRESGRSAWSLFNSFTEVLKAVSPFELPKRRQAPHGLFDHQTGLLDNLAAGAAHN